jgi:hypothetical protein
MLSVMRTPIVLRALTPDERHALTAGVRAPTRVTVRHVRHAFTTHGLAALQPGASAPHYTPHAVFDASRRARLRAWLHQTPRTFGKPSSLWTLPLAAAVAEAAGLSSRHGSGEALRRALRRLGVRWQRANPWSTSPDPASTRKNNRAPD